MIKPIDLERKYTMLQRVEEHSDNKLISNQPKMVDFSSMKVIRKRQAISKGQGCLSRGYILLQMFW
jgi:hypothetical protein